jgi:hypothetical protein
LQGNFPASGSPVRNRINLIETIAAPVLGYKEQLSIVFISSLYWLLA